MTAPRVFVSAGEPSGDRHAAALVTALKQAAPDVAVDAIGGPALAAAGATIVFPSERLGAMGLVESASSLPQHVQALRLVRRRLRNAAWDLVILVDYPGFHLRLAQQVRRAGLPLLYYIAPQLWAWGARRARVLAESVTRLAVVLPFEEAFFRRLGVASQFVGHPLAGLRPCADPSRARRDLGLDADRPVLALLPGSRAGDVARHGRLFLEAAQQLCRDMPTLQVVVACADGTPGAAPPGGLVVRNQTARVLGAADAALCKSGTATLEAALRGTPMVIAYRLHPVTFAVARRAVTVPWIGLPNLVAGRQVVPELIQRAATPDALAAAVRPLLDPRSDEAAAQRIAFAEIREALGSPGAAERAAALALDLAA